MKLLHVITGLSTGGAEQALHNVLAGGLATEFETAVLSLGDQGSIGPRIEALGVPVHALGMNFGLPALAVMHRLRAVVRGFRPDVVQGWMYHGNLAASVAAWLAAGGPAVAWNVRCSLPDHASEKRLTRYVVRANRALSDRANAIIYNSYLSRGQHEAFGFGASRGRLIPNGFDLELLKPDEQAGAWVREQLGISRQAPVVGHVARFHPMKDHASFLQAAVAVARQIPEVRFVLVGRGVTPDNPALAGLIPRELLGQFVFAGEQPNAHSFMQALDLLCLSSWTTEGFPNVLGEAMSCGVPCVTTDVGDSAAIVGDTGVVVPASDSEALARGLLAMLGAPTEERRARGREARRRIEVNYALDAAVGQYSQLYRTLGKKYMR